MAYENEKAESELDGCTFTPDIGKKGIVYTTMKKYESTRKGMTGASLVL